MLSGMKKFHPQPHMAPASSFICSFVIHVFQNPYVPRQPGTTKVPPERTIQGFWRALLLVKVGAQTANIALIKHLFVSVAFPPTTTLVRLFLVLYFWPKGLFPFYTQGHNWTHPIRHHTAKKKRNQETPSIDSCRESINTAFFKKWGYWHQEEMCSQWAIKEVLAPKWMSRGEKYCDFLRVFSATLNTAERRTSWLFVESHQVRLSS